MHKQPMLFCYVDLRLLPLKTADSCEEYLNVCVFPACQPNSNGNWEIEWNGIL